MKDKFEDKDRAHIIVYLKTKMIIAMQDDIDDVYEEARKAVMHNFCLSYDSAVKFVDTECAVYISEEQSAGLLKRFNKEEETLVEDTINYCATMIEVYLEDVPDKKIITKEVKQYILEMCESNRLAAIKHLLHDKQM